MWTQSTCVCVCVCVYVDVHESFHRVILIGHLLSFPLSNSIVSLHSNKRNLSCKRQQEKEKRPKWMLLLPIAGSSFGEHFCFKDIIDAKVFYDPKNNNYYSTNEWGDPLLSKLGQLIRRSLFLTPNSIYQKNSEGPNHFDKLMKWHSILGSYIISTKKLRKKLFFQKHLKKSMMGNF